VASAWQSSNSEEILGRPAEVALGLNSTQQVLIDGYDLIIQNNLVQVVKVRAAESHASSVIY
jgi:hypothetical protein